jgi:hypothetical protein
MQDVDFSEGKKSAPESAGRILSDLRLAASAGLTNLIKGDKVFQKFLSLNDVGAEVQFMSNLPVEIVQAARQALQIKSTDHPDRG